jgi:hypothetical protein
MSGTQEQQGEEQQGQEAESEEAQKSKEAEEKYERAHQKIEELEENPPEKLEDWPQDEAKYQTFGGSEEGEVIYDEKHEEALGEHSVRHFEDGSVEVKGKKVDNPEEYKGEPIPGGPTDPDAPKIAGEQDLSDTSSTRRSDDDSGEE